MKGVSQLIVKLLPPLLLLAVVAIATTSSGQAVVEVKCNTNKIHPGVALLCVASELYPCMPSLTTSMDPSRKCCQKLREQQPCFCEYLKNPTFRPYVHGYRTKQICMSCGVQFPTSC